ncbi:MAG: type II toxin-antitoxin system HicA family toxin [Armatimonadota bacterium]|nr:type II toxin-antitoxin system HicA family toxin [Armatimonadota bacterium]
MYWFAKAGVIYDIQRRRVAHGARVTLPFHPGKILHPKLLQSILKDANLSVDDLGRLLR